MCLGKVTVGIPENWWNPLCSSGARIPKNPYHHHIFSFWGHSLANHRKTWLSKVPFCLWDTSVSQVQHSVPFIYIYKKKKKKKHNRTNYLNKSLLRERPKYNPLRQLVVFIKKKSFHGCYSLVFAIHLRRWAVSREEIWKTGFVAECAIFYKYWLNHYPVCICLAVLSCNEVMGIFSTVRVRFKNFSTEQKFEHVHWHAFRPKCF